jgi:hypothetical protein
MRHRCKGLFGCILKVPKIAIHFMLQLPKVRRLKSAPQLGMPKGISPHFYISH